MTPLERLFVLEVEYHRILRRDAPGTPPAAAPHISYALQHGYETLLRVVAPSSIGEVDSLLNRPGMAGDGRDVLAARDSLVLLLGLRPYDE